ncbi:30S ribosomal protein S6 [Paenibacillus turpanensis]|uniref:30S ribosomal protein S6 n=1 Tax=Paenibacillus turpanensis TaxID=2689078 RepID=UPI0014087992|nr:30S ribosomal protein S6 [Paenibacillus turpanensis]
MRNYEVMFILRPELDEQQVQAAVEKFANIINNGGEITKQNVMGKRRLAYEINKIRDGIYVLVNFKGNNEVIKELDRVMRISDEVIRFLILQDVVA